jgi:uncharacterized protein (TIGR03663 family)
MRPMLAVAIVLAAISLRFPALEHRPMHADEAVQAARLGTLIETGSYQYDRTEHHGPALLYLSWIPARAAGAHSHAALSERLLRVVPAVAGTLTAAGVLLLAPELGLPAALAAAALTAVSPAMVYYSRYYIPEMLLVLACFAAILCGWRYAIAPRLLLAVVTGACAGAAFAVKETAVLALAAGVAGLAATRAWRRLRAAHAASAVAAALAVITISYGTSLPAFFASFGQYAARAATGGRHSHPWHYYFGLVTSWPVGMDALAIPLALAGGWIAFRDKKALGRFIAVYTIALAVLYSAIPYKTPWCMLGFWHGVLLLGGIGAGALVRRFPAAGVAALAATAGLAAFQAQRAAFLYAVDPRNPYVYAHTTADIYKLRGKLDQLARAHPDRDAIEIQVFSDQNVWPLPWYLREFPNVRWWTGVPNSVAPASVILVSPALEPALARLLDESRPPGQRELYMTIFDDVQLRPGVELHGYAAKTVWDRL